MVLNTIHYTQETIQYDRRDYDNTINSILDLLKKFKNYLISKVKNEKHNIQDTEIIEESYSQLVQKWFEDTEIFAEFVREYNFIKEEYTAFLEIKNIMDIIIKKTIGELNTDDLEILLMILEDYIKLHNLKFKLIKKTYKNNVSKLNLDDLSKEDKLKYLNEFDNFIYNFFEQKVKFYSMQEKTNNYSQTIHKLFNETIDLEKE
ncbi:hypothetical protein [Methanobrevibacter curvatus]|uniref:Uncharacterized protein n=1 Tax=Methanobrevibacter curvatus TaxID=49547 RepID=A0A166ANU3_9EURY|nr:hypothetical protein [Methanobrevibacter curvatus]KZX12279.1 hypothetical protein MBCUR_11310 [Methanobrevibacter curvatus]